MNNEPTPNISVTGFKVGDVVELRSGSPLMTIVKVSEPSLFRRKINITCMWFVNNNPITGRFHPETLRLLRL